MSYPGILFHGGREGFSGSIRKISGSMVFMQAENRIHGI